MATMHPAALTPAPAVMRVLGRFDRKSLASFIAVAIELLDEIDGDPDLEDATDAEDEGFSPWTRRWAGSFGPGCPISDPGGGNVEDGGEEEAGI